MTSIRDKIQFRYKESLKKKISTEKDLAMQYWTEFPLLNLIIHKNWKMKKIINYYFLN